MSNRRVKSLEYDDDLEYDEPEDDYEEQEEISQEDKEQLRLGTVKVRSLLDSSYQVSDAAIQDALWNYYYDIEKTVTYIKNKHKPKTAPTKPSQSQRKSCISFCLRLLPRQAIPFTSYITKIRSDLSARPERLFVSAKELFTDCPWGCVPEYRKAELVQIPSTRPRGLLGGASNQKMSKLAALAAKRRLKEVAAPAKPEQEPSQDEYAANLSKLSLGSDKPRGKQKSEREDSDAARHNSSQKESTDQNPLSKEDTVSDDEDAPVVERTKPSAFADTFRNTESGPAETIDATLLRQSSLGFDFASPSPDDVPKQQPKSQSKTNATNGIKNLSIQDQPKVKSKNIDVLAEYGKTQHKNSANFVVIGHVDAGKSTLMGRLLFDLKAIDQRTIDKYQKEADTIGKGSFAFAWVLDQGTEERERGVTIDIATNKFETEQTSFTILDAPGHQDFVPNMIAGASQADFAVLVIDASPGNFESGLRGQTREHALLAKSIGVQRLIVAVNKMDTVDWSEERFNDIKTQMSTFLKATKFNLESTAFIPCSGLQGTNILKPVTDPAAAWYSKNSPQTLVQALDMFEPVKHKLEKPLRMTVGDVFRGGVQNPLSISGRIEAGSLQLGDQILVQPSGETATIRTLDLEHDDSDTIHEWAVAGQNVILHLIDIDPIHLRPGDVICKPGPDAITNSQKLSAHILSFAYLTPMNVDVHKGRLHVPGRITQLVGVLDKKTGEIVKKKPKIVKPEEAVRVTIELERGVPVESGSRIVLRSNGETVGAGLVE